MYVEMSDVRVETTAFAKGHCGIDPHARIAVTHNDWGVQLNVGTDSTLAMAYLNLHQALALMDMLSEAIIEVRTSNWAAADEHL